MTPSAACQSPCVLCPTKSKSQLVTPYSSLSTPGRPTDEQVSKFSGGYSGSVSYTLPGGLQVARSSSLPSFDMSATEIGRNYGRPGFHVSVTGSKYITDLW